MPKRLLLIVHHRPNRSPGQRFRIEQFLPCLEKAGYEVTISNIISEKDDKTFYSHGHYFGKLMFVIKSYFHRLKDVRRAKNFDLIFIYREAYMLGTTIFERKLAKSGVPVIFDFDDSIWLNDTSEGNQNLAWMKRTEKTDEICKIATIVSVGNQYLADYARQFNDNIFILPTVINTSYHKPTEKKPHNGICIGWTGTQTTLKHYETAFPVLKRLKEKYGDKVYFKVITNTTNWHSEIPDTQILQWSAENEIEELCEFDIGIMPLPNDKWSRGKCGFKGLQCMAMELPVVMSPVGVNKDIIDDGKNGFLASTDDEWVEKLSALIDSEELRREIGKNARKTVEERFSATAWADKVVETFDGLIKK
ncbi:MAG: glycosyltransferase family 4 protein [Bacteroidales bacterium]|nr:glycosyltransferase family 4 protein [Bacteroidales bacterium]